MSRREPLTLRVQVKTAKNAASTMDEKYQTLTVEIERLKSKYRIGIIIGAIGILLIGSLGF